MKGFGLPGYFVFGVFALVLSWATSGCRFGNNEVTVAEPETIDGYYRMRADAFTLRVNTNSLTQSEQEQNTPTNMIPSEIGSPFSDPVFFGFFPDDGMWLIVNPFTLDAQQIFVDEGSGDLSAIGFGESVLWDDDRCGLLLTVDYIGSVNDGNTDEVLGYQTKGDIDLAIELSRTMMPDSPGDCDASLQEMSTCYTTGSNCSAGDQEYVTQLFGIYIDAGMITANDFVNLHSVGYSVAYD